MTSTLFQRQPLPAVDDASSAPEPDPIDVALIEEPMADEPAGSGDAASPSETPIVIVPTMEQAESAVEEALAAASPYEQLIRLTDAYEHELLTNWTAATAATERAVASINEKRVRERDAVTKDHNDRMAALERGVQGEMESVARRAAELRKGFEEFVSSSNRVALDVWGRIGRGLELDRPTLRTAGEIAASQSNAYVYPADYETCRQQAEQLPSFAPSFSEDSGLKTKLGWITGIAFLFGIGNFGFGGGLMVAAWAAGGVLFWNHHRRSNARDLFARLIDLTPAAQAQHYQAIAAELAEKDAQIAEAKARVEAERQESLKEVAAQHSAIDAKYVAPFAQEREAWDAKLAGCTALLDATDEGIVAAIGAQPVRLGRWDAEAENDAETPSLSDQLRVRIGERKLKAPATLTAAASALLGRPPQAWPLANRPPAFFDLAEKRSLLLRDNRPAGAGTSGTMGAVVARMMQQLQPGKLNLTLFDPVGLGRNYSAFLKLSDYSDLLINGKVWSEKEHIRRKLKELIEHIETVTQKYLRADFQDIESYNENAGEIAEAYRLLCVADFPEAFDEESIRDLVRIVQNGARCGVFALIHHNEGTPLPYGVDLTGLTPFCATLSAAEGAHSFVADPAVDRQLPVLLDPPPPAAVLDKAVGKFGEGAQAAKRVEVPYKRMLEIAKIAEDDWWTRTSEKCIEAPLGPAGAKKVQILQLGTGLAHHALIVGRPGSGKSNLIHVFISTVARLYAPDEVQLYLVDFKKGVEFKAYAEAALPHARVIAVESEREFGLSVLQGLDAELKRRGELFRTAGSSNFAEYRGKTGEKLPRIVLIVDEFQEFFSREDRIARDAGVLFDRLVRQGRAFGMHLMLGTQSLANAGLPKPTQDQMAVRIALQCSEADSRLILADDNLVARSLTRPGEAIFNDAAGLVEGNNQFQVAMFSEEDRTRELAVTARVAARKKWRGEPPVIFEGHEPAELAACRPLLAAAPSERAERLEAWLGEPTALKPPVAALFRRQSGRNMMVLTRDEEQGVGVVLAALCSIAAQTTETQASFRIIDLTAADADWADHPEAFAECVPHDAEVLGKRDMRQLLPEMEQLVKQRVEAGDHRAAGIFLVILGLQRARDLRADDGGGFSMNFDAEPAPNLAGALETILQDGPEVGVHTILWCDSLGNLDRVIDRRGLNEIGLRVSAGLSGPDSHRVFDEDVAAGIDKPHRLVKFDDEQVGVFDMFRPYALPSGSFFQEFGAKLRARATPAKTKKASR